MDKLKGNIQHVMLQEFKNNKNVVVTVKKVSGVYDQSARFETDLQIFILVIKRWTQTKILIRSQSRCYNKWNAIHAKVVKN